MFDVAKDLKERFDYAAYFYLSAWERDPNMRIEGNTIIREEDDFEEIMIDTFEALRDSVDAIPATVIKDVEKFYDSVGAVKYEEIIMAAIQRVDQSAPKDATEFIESIKLGATYL